MTLTLLVGRAGHQLPQQSSQEGALATTHGPCHAQQLPWAQSQTDARQGRAYACSSLCNTLHKRVTPLDAGQPITLHASLQGVCNVLQCTVCWICGAWVRQLVLAAVLTLYSQLKEGLLIARRSSCWIPNASCHRVHMHVHMWLHCCSAVPQLTSDAAR
jgi:hypothetical protein